jgi:hypothetical protein
VIYKQLPKFPKCSEFNLYNLFQAIFTIVSCVCFGQKISQDLTTEFQRCFVLDVGCPGRLFTSCLLAIGTVRPLYILYDRPVGLKDCSTVNTGVIDKIRDSVRQFWKQPKQVVKANR